MGELFIRLSMQALAQAQVDAMCKPGILSVFISFLLFCPTASAQAETLLKTAGTLSETSDARLEDGSLYDAHQFSGSSGQQVTIILESRDFDPYLILLDPDGERIDENDDISRTNLNSRLVVILPSTGTYTLYANSYDAAKSGAYDVTVRTDDQSTSPANLSALLSPTTQCGAALLGVVQAVETNRDVRVLPGVLQLMKRYETIPEGKTNGLEMLLSGTATPSIMASSHLIKRVASSLIHNCSSIGTVAFRPEASAEERIFGYSFSNTANTPTEPLVEEFNCAPNATLPASTRSLSTEEIPPMLWGQKRCS